MQTIHVTSKAEVQKAVQKGTPRCCSGNSGMRMEQEVHVRACCVLMKLQLQRAKLFARYMYYVLMKVAATKNKAFCSQSLKQLAIVENEEALYTYCSKNRFTWRLYKISHLDFSDAACS